MDEINSRLFGLEGRMTTLERVSEIQGQARTALLEIIVAKQEHAEKRLRAMEIKIAWATGAIALLQVVLKFSH